MLKYVSDTTNPFFMPILGGENGRVYVNRYRTKNREVEGSDAIIGKGVKKLRILAFEEKKYVGDEEHMACCCVIRTNVLMLSYPLLTTNNWH